MKRALLVGIDDYSFNPLDGCVNDVNAMHMLLERDANRNPNFECVRLTAPSASVTKAVLRKRVQELFAHEADVALFYFSGHGTVTALGALLVTQDAEEDDMGLPLSEVLALATKAPVTEVILILDCCFSGAAGGTPVLGNEGDMAHLREGLSILTASRATQTSAELRATATSPARGLFTSLVCEALAGGAADVLGEVTVASIYAYVDQTLGAWQQRPLLKSHVSKLIPLRKCLPAVDIEALRALPQYFPDATKELPLDPSYEPDAAPRHDEHEHIFDHLQQMRSAGLVVPIGEKHLYFAAMNSKSCKLTPLGVHYHRRAKENRL